MLVFPGILVLPRVSSNFHSLEVVYRVSETQLQVGENFACLLEWRVHSHTGSRYAGTFRPTIPFCDDSPPLEGLINPVAGGVTGEVCGYRR